MSDNKLSTTFYRKYNSFQDHILTYRRSNPQAQLERSFAILESLDYGGAHPIFSNFSEVLVSVRDAIKASLTVKDSNLLGACNSFHISELVAEEMATVSDTLLPLYLYHRWRFEENPKQFIIDKYPPYVQIEPSSICNYRCKFCYQTDSSFTEKDSGYMGTMAIDDYKKIIDMLRGKVEFISLASRGEPSICKDLSSMLAYSKNKFLNLKINTNASLMTEDLAHALLDGGAKTIVFSIDAHSQEMYEELRVNGKFEKLLRGLSLFKKIREDHFCRDDSIVRISGVYMDERQDMNLMHQTWGEYVDQITFVKYNPWENVYTSEKTHISKACSDLWRRIFIWQDGSINCCDTDYKSTLLSGSCLDSELSSIWHSEQYIKLRNQHLEGLRQSCAPCNRCSVV